MILISMVLIVLERQIVPLIIMIDFLILQRSVNYIAELVLPRNLYMFILKMES